MRKRIFFSVLALSVLVASFSSAYAQNGYTPFEDETDYYDDSYNNGSDGVTSSDAFREAAFGTKNFGGYEANECAAFAAAVNAGQGAYSGYILGEPVSWNDVLQANNDCIGGGYIGGGTQNPDNDCATNAQLCPIGGGEIFLLLFAGIFTAVKRCKKKKK